MPSTILAAVGNLSRQPGDDETVLWRGRPHAGSYVWRLWWPPALIAGPVLVFGIVWEWMAVTGGHLIVYPILGALFPIFGVYGLAVRPLLLARAVRRTDYKVTDQRVVWRWGRREGMTLPVAALPPWFVVPRGADRADVLFFGTPPRVSRWGMWRLVDQQTQFICLSAADADDAAAALRAAAAYDEHGHRHVGL